MSQITVHPQRPPCRRVCSEEYTSILCTGHISPRVIWISRLCTSRPFLQIPRPFSDPLARIPLRSEMSGGAKRRFGLHPGQLRRTRCRPDIRTTERMQDVLYHK
jgi:hypothetical protein